MTTRYIRLPIVVSDTDPSKCSEECPFLNFEWAQCDAVRERLTRELPSNADDDAWMTVWHRHPACAAASRRTVRSLTNQHRPP